MSDKEAVGAAFDVGLMRRASEKSWQAVACMREQFRPGLRESEAHILAECILRDIGMERFWHPTHIRFGANTTKTFRQASEGDPVLAEDDIYFIDIGPVFDGHEGDVGATFVVGADAEKLACATAAETLFHAVSAAWKNGGRSGHELYAFARQRADELGWRLNLDIKGHRASDFPHAIHRGGNLGDFDGLPVPGVWVLEIQIAHPTKPFGAFYEDVLF